MTKKSSLVRNAIVLAFVSSIGFSQAASAAPCSAEVNALKTALNDDFCRFDKVCKGLNRKLDKVNHSLEKGKYRKAARKLADFGSVVEDIADGNKRRFQRKGFTMDQETYEQLMGVHFNAAAACLNNPTESVPVQVADATPAEPEPAPVPDYVPAEEEFY